MGSLYSRTDDTNCTFENVHNPSSSAAPREELTGSIYDMDPLTQEVVRYEDEFKKTSRRLSNVLDSMEDIPCREASFEIVSCLRGNPNRMGECMSSMSAYQKCVREATKNKLDQFAYEIKT